MGQKAYTLSINAVFIEYKTSSLGLSLHAARERQKKYGPNEVATRSKINYLIYFFRQFQSPLVYILLIAAFVSLFLGRQTDFWLILIIVILNAMVGWFQEVKAEKSLAALKKIIALRARVIRNDEEMEIPAIDLVPGDIVIIEEGSKIPADCRLIEANDLKIDESTLTGESVPVYKTTKPISEKTSLADISNMVFSGTVATSGRGKAVVIDIGPNTQIGQISQEITVAEEENSPLIIKIQELSKKILIGALIICFLFFVLGIIRGLSIFEMFFTAVAAAVAVIPEGLPAVITLTLAIGVHSLSKQSAIIRKLVAVESLGSITVIATDKTGTLTLNQMTAEKLCLSSNRIINISGKGYRPKGTLEEDGAEVVKSDAQLKNFAKIVTLCNNASLFREDGDWQILGDPTEGALITLSSKAGYQKEDMQFQYPRLAEVPFSSQYHFMATLNKDGKNHFVATKGSLEKIISLSKFILTKSGIKPLDKERKQEIISLAHKWAHESYRIIACAYKITNSKVKSLQISNVKNLVFSGFCAIDDPPRVEAKNAIFSSQTAGIRPIMITGDHPLTALSIAQKLGITKEGGEVISGLDWEKTPLSQLQEKIKTVNVYARINPHQKLEIISLLQKNGEIVGMTGDGVNDAPVLKEANIGIAMGMGGTDVAKEASEMILVDNNFATLINAIKIGRTIFSNIRKAVFFMISTNIGEAMILFFSLLIGLPLPLIAVQILWINLITDGTEGISLTMEPPESGILKQKPRPAKEGILTQEIIIRVLIIAIVMATITLGLFFFYLKSGASLEKARSVAFVTMSILQIMNLFNSRSFKKSIFETKLFSNRYLWYAIILGLILTIATVSAPSLIRLFNTTLLGWVDWLRIISCSIVIILAVEIEKFIRRISNRSINE